MSGDIYRLGDFELERELGRGGMAAVWFATNRRFGGEAAVKVMEGSVARGEKYRRIFQDEVRSHARFTHPSIVQLLDYGEIAGTDAPPPGAREGDPYLVMEVARGTLRDRFATLSWTTVLPTLLQVLDALAYAHARGVVHRDLKPENVLVFDEAGRRVKLSDFGIAHSVKLDETADRSSLATMVGTPHYMAPEQFRGHWYEFGPWTDLYALGCVAYELTTGATPFDSKGVFELAMLHTDSAMPEPNFRFEVPPGFDAWLARLMEKEARNRFQSAADAAHMLLRIARGFRPSGDVRGAIGEEDSIANEPTEILDFVDQMTTLHDAMEEFGTADTLWPSDGVVASFEGAHAEARTVLPCAITPATMPARWRAANVDAGQSGGLGLFAFREPPLVGFDDVRDRLWAALSETVSGSGVKAIVLRGESAAPNLEIGRWLGVRATEVGVGTSIELGHSRAGGPREGLVGMLEDFFGTWALRDDVIRERVAHVLDELELDSAELYAESLSVEILRSRGVPGTVDVVSRAQIARMTATLLTARASERPVVLRVDDVQRNTLTAGFVREFVQLSPDSPVLVVVTVAQDEEPAVGAAAELEAIVEHGATRVVDVRRYSTDEQADIVRELLPLDEEAIGRICAVTAGDLVAARLLISELIETEAVRPLEERFTVDSEALPADVDAMLASRARRRLNTEAAQHLFEIAGLLGESPDLSELAEAAELAGVDADIDEFVGTLLDAGLAEGKRHRWSMAHPRLTAVAQRWAELAGRAEALHRACARAIVRRASPDLPEPWVRAARHFVRSGRPRDALEPLNTAAALLRGSRERVEEIVDWHGEIIRVLQLGKDAPEVVDQRLLRSPMLWAEGEREEALKQARAAADAARATGYLRGLAGAERQLARLMIASGDTDEAARHFETAADVAASSGSALDQAAAEFGLGTVYYRIGDLDAATKRYRRAIELYGEGGSPRRQALALSYLSAAQIAAGDLDAAEASAESAMAIAVKTGQLELVASIGQDMGELARFRGNLDAALHHYEESRHLSELLGADVTIADVNIALVSVAQGLPGVATPRLAEARRRVEARGQNDIAAVISAALSAAAALRGQEEEANEELDRCISEVGEAGDRDVAWVLASVAPQIENSSIAGRYLRLAIEHYERLGDDRRVAEVAALLDDATDPPSGDL